MGANGIRNLTKHILEPFPRVKRACKRVYQAVGYALSNEKIEFEGEVRRVSPEDDFEYFFGYYDKSPWDAQDRRMIALRVRQSWESPAPAQPGELVLIDTGNDNRVIPFATVNAWNVQQGCRAQWLGPDFDRYILYNDFRDGAYCPYGQNWPNTLLTAMDLFAAEFEAHTKKKSCPAGVCFQAGATYVILPDKCTGCMDCEDACDYTAITGKKGFIHMIDQDMCEHCGECVSACDEEAIVKWEGAKLPKLPKKLTRVGKF